MVAVGVAVQKANIARYVLYMLSDVRYGVR